MKGVPKLGPHIWKPLEYRRTLNRMKGVLKLGPQISSPEIHHLEYHKVLYRIKRDNKLGPHIFAPYCIKGIPKFGTHISSGDWKPWYITKHYIVLRETLN